MKGDIKISAIIPCFNESDAIRKALESVLHMDEVLVVDSFSTDDTMDILAEYPQVRVIQHEYINSAAQKNWIIPQAKHPWIFLLDADEIMTASLREEVENLDLTRTKYTAYSIHRQNYFFGKKLRHVWKNDRVLRLFRRDLSRYQDLEVHSKLETQGPVGYLDHSIDHHSFKSLDHYKDKMLRYAEWSARDYEHKTGAITVYHLWIKPAARFIKHYFIQGGLWDGRAGFQISRIQAWAVWMRYHKMQTLRRGS